MSDVMVDSVALREEVRKKYREVATDPHGDHHFHTGRFLAAHLGYDGDLVNPLPDAAVESFAGVANPFSLGKHMWRDRLCGQEWPLQIDIQSEIPILLCNFQER